MLVADILRRNATYFGDNDAVVDQASAGVVVGAARGSGQPPRQHAARLGLPKGDRVAVLSPNSPDYVTFFFACSLSGLLGAPLNVRLTSPELISYLNYVRSRALLVGDGQEVPRRSSPPGSRRSSGVVGMVVDQPTAHPRRPPHRGAADAIRAATSTARRRTCWRHQRHDRVSKAVVQTNANAIAAITAWQAELPVAERQTALQNIPHVLQPGWPGRASTRRWPRAAAP